MSLADRFIEEGFVPVDPIKSQQDLADSAFAWVYGHLCPPDYMTKDSAWKTADRFMFDRDPSSIGYQLRKSGQVDPDLMKGTVRLPSPITWLEWRPAGEKHLVGVLLCEVEDRDQIAGVAVVEGEGHGSPAPYLTFTMDKLPHVVDGPIIGNCHWLVGTPVRSSDRTVELRHVAWDVISALFLLCVPRACEVRESVPSHKLQRNRIRRGKLPMLEMKRVTVRVAEGPPRYKRSGDPAMADSEGGHKRLHSVIGHFRTYQKGREVPKVSWVPQHWRGDPELGVLLHEREVKS